MIREVNPKKVKTILGLIFVFALIIRFLWFRQTTYFGFDEARDAFVSQEIYTKGDWKLIGPPATGNIGLFHGSLYWYLIGPIYLLFGGDHYLVSALFRVINALGVFLVFGIGSLLFSRTIGLITALLFAISFEQSQYAWYAGKESLAVLCFLGIIYGVLLLFKNEKYRWWGLPLIAFCFSWMVQFNLIFIANGLAIAILLLIVNKGLKKVTKSSYIVSAITALVLLSTYILTEIKYGFRSVKMASELVSGGFGIMSPGESKYTLYWNKFLMMFHDNIFSFNTKDPILAVIAIIFAIYIAKQATKKIEFRILLTWIFSWVGLMLVGGHMAYYTHVGVSVGILVTVAYLLQLLYKKNRLASYLLLTLVTLSNLYLIYGQRNVGLIGGIKPQPYMNLSDEVEVLDRMYKKAGGKGFTVRLTGIPYKVQTVWAYVLNQYGLKKYGYLPYWENGNVEGFPGHLPPPDHGTNCIRFLVREPMRGLPVEIVDEDSKTENLFSKIVVIEGLAEGLDMFVLEERISTDQVCHNDKPQNVN